MINPGDLYSVEAVVGDSVSFDTDVNSKVMLYQAASQLSESNRKFHDVDWGVSVCLEHGLAT